jgi:hypothetical protein
MQRRSSPQDITWFLDLRRNKQLELDPPYQRRSVWNRHDRRFFLDTVFRGYPCPPIFLNKTLGPEQQAIYNVVDGKQRLQTLFMFVDNEINLSDDFGQERLNGKTWAELGTDEKQTFWNYVIPVEFLTFGDDETLIVNQAFDRLNRNMRKLEPQELRHARWDGWFIKTVEKECEDQAWRTLGVVTNARSKRMKDAQFMSELLLVLISGQQIGFSQEAIDDAYALHDDIDEADETIDVDDITLKLETAKQYLLAVNGVNECVKESARAIATCYTLWVVVALYRQHLTATTDFAAQYATFMDSVGEIRAATFDPAVLTGPNAEAYRLPNEYARGLSGASTDLGPRNRRLSALLEYLGIAQQ